MKKLWTQVAILQEIVALQSCNDPQKAKAGVRISDTGHSRSIAFRLTRKGPVLHWLSEPMKTWIAIMPALTLLSCSATTDPLTKQLKGYGYYPATPPSKKLSLGDIYRQPSTKGRPVVFLHQLIGDDQVKEIFKNLADPVELGSISGDRKYDLSVNADVIGYVSAALEAHGVRKFSIKYGNAIQYKITDYNWDHLGPPEPLRKRITDAWPAAPLVGNYVVTGVLRVDSLEYELEDGHGAKIDITPGSEIEKIVKAALKGEWSANQNGNISFNDPKHPTVVGVEFSQVAEAGGLLAGSSATSSSATPSAVASATPGAAARPAGHQPTEIHRLKRE